VNFANHDKLFMARLQYRQAPLCLLQISIDKALSRFQVRHPFLPFLLLEIQIRGGNLTTALTHLVCHAFPLALQLPYHQFLFLQFHAHLFDRCCFEEHL
jgi:hypothetical protein